MKLTERDKKLLIGLGIFIFVVVFAKFLFLPKLSNIKALNQEINKLNSTYAVNTAYKSKAKNIDSDIKVLYSKLTNLRSVYPPSIDITELVVTIKNLSKDSGIDFNKITFDSYKPAEDKGKSGAEAETSSETDIQETTSTLNESDNQLNSESEANKVTSNKYKKYFSLWGLGSQVINEKEKILVDDGKPYSVTVKVEGEGTNEQIKTFLIKLDKLDTKAYCNSISISGANSGKSEDTNNKLKFSATITFYGIMDSPTSGYYLLPDGKWSPVVPANNKTNLFKEYSGFTSSSTAGSSVGTSDTSTNGMGNDEKSNLEENDFAIVALPYGGGYAPSVSIACKNPETTNENFTSAVIYGDSKGIENAEIFIEEKAGRLFCKFKTDYEAFPDTDYSKTFEFIPNGKDLKLVILSSERYGDKDKAGINLNIINNSKRTLKYSIIHDDEKSPRVKIGKTVGSVINEK